jgi:hypothetical protein
MRLFNPLENDFSYEWFDDKNKSHTLKLPSLTITDLPDIQGTFMLKHLSDEVLNKRWTKGFSTDHQLEEIKKEILIQDEILT